MGDEKMSKHVKRDCSGYDMCLRDIDWKPTHCKGCGLYRKTVEKTTTFEGYMAQQDDYLVLCKLSFEEWKKVQWDRIHKREYPQPDPLLCHPRKFFPDECYEGKWRFRITVEAEKKEE